MKRFLFAVAAVALVASVGSAEDKPATPPATATPAAVGAPGASVSEHRLAIHRRGLLSRLRNRGSSTTVTPATAPVPMPAAPTPKPMPGTKSTTGEKSPPSGVVVAGGTDKGKVTTASHSEPAQRRALLNRLRNR